MMLNNLKKSIDNENKKDIFTKLLRSYLTIVFFPIIILSVVVILGILTTVSSDINSMNDTIFSQCQNNLDKNLRSINTVVYQLAQNDNVNDFLYKKYDEGVVQNYHASKIIKKIKECETTNSIFDSIAVYFAENNMVIDSENVYSVKEYFSSWSQEPSEWIENSRKTKCAQYNDCIIFSKPFSGSHGNDNKIIVMIKMSDIFKIYDVMKMNGDLCFVVADSSGNVLVNSNSDISIKKLPEFTEESGTFEIKASNKKFKARYNHSSVENLVYTCLIPKNKMAGNTFELLCLFVFIVFFCIMLCLILALYNTKKSYIPINMAIEENEKLNGRIEEIENVVKKKVIINLLRGIYFEDEREGLVEPLKKNLPGSNIVVVVIDSNEKDKDAVFGDREEILRLVVYENFLQCEVISNDEGKNICVISYDNENLVDIFKNAVETLYKEKKFRINIAIGESVNDIFKLSTSYDTALLTLNYLFRTGADGCVLEYDPKSMSDSIDFSLDKKTAITECVKSGEYEKVEMILDGVYEANFINRRLEKLVLLGLINRLSANLLEILDGLFVKNSQRQRAYINVCKEAMTSENLYEGFDILKIAYIDLAKQVKVFLKEKSDNRIDEILNFIHENYSNNEMSLTFVSTKMNINYQYLSKLFVAETGKYFVDYLNQYRLEKSKELLENTRKSIEEIAAHIGFTSANSYIRTFKKYYGVTPGQYKKNIQIHQ